jgi:hypothetical protein
MQLSSFKHLGYLRGIKVWRLSVQMYTSYFRAFAHPKSIDNDIAEASYRFVIATMRSQSAQAQKRL